MPDTRSQFQVNISGLDKLVGVFEQLIEGFKKATRLTKKQREEMRRALSETCELIDTILTMVKQRISDVRKAVRDNDPKAKDIIYDLGNSSIWEKKYREFQLCLPLRRGTREISDKFLGRLVSRFSFKDPDSLRYTIREFLDGEQVAGDFVKKLLFDLSRLDEEVEERKEFVMAELERARGSIQEYRDKFIDLERQIREAI